MASASYVIAAGSVYLCDHGSAFAWTRNSDKARRFPSKEAAGQYFKDLVGGEPRVVRI